MNIYMMDIYYGHMFRINTNSILFSMKKRIRIVDVFAEYFVGGWKAVGSTGRRTCWTTRGRMVEHATTRLKHRQGRRGEEEKRNEG